MRFVDTLLLALFALASGCACGDSHLLTDSGAPGLDAFVAPDAAAEAPDATSPADAAMLSDAISLADAACTRPTGIDPDGLSVNCRESGMCLPGYECLDHSGALLDRFCGIPCEAEDGGECACPADLFCGTREDKTGTHRECMRGDL